MTYEPDRLAKIGQLLLQCRSLTPDIATALDAAWWAQDRTHRSKAWVRAFAAIASSTAPSQWGAISFAVHMALTESGIWEAIGARALNASIDHAVAVAYADVIEPRDVDTLSAPWLSVGSALWT